VPIEAVTRFSAVNPKIDSRRLSRAFLAAFADHEAFTKEKRKRR